MVKRSKCLAAMTLAAVLGSCGGGGGSSGGGAPPVTVAPSPTPTPTPTPPPAPPAPVLSVAGVQPMLAQVRFYPDGFNPNAFTVIAVAGGRDSLFPTQTPLPMNTIGSAPANYAALDKFAFGVDPAGSFLTSAQAPRDSLVISPVSHLLMGGNTEAKLEAQLGITGGLFALLTDRDLKTFSVVEGLRSADPAVVADAERLQAHHLRIQMLTGVINNWGFPEQDPTGGLTFIPRTSDSDTQTLAKYLAGAPAAFIFTNANMAALLRSFPTNGRTYGDDVVAAAAHLVNAYAATISVRIISREQSARFMIGIKGYLIPEILRLLAENNSAAVNRALAVNSGVIMAETARYTEQLPFDVNDTYFTSPDFYTLAAGTTKLVDAVDVGSNGDGPFTDNDMHLRPSPSGGPFFRGVSTITAVTVPQLNANEIAATLLPDGTVSIRPLSGFTGVTWFDYTTRHERGEVETGRVYVRVRA